MKISTYALQHTYVDRGSALPALRTLSLEIEAGEFVALIGPSGCGKSTLLRLLANLLLPTAGQIDFDGQTPALAVAAGRIAWLAQSPALLPWYTARANIELVHKIHPQADTSRSPDDLLHLVGLGDFGQTYPFTLSGGMQQCLAQGADLWLMDEPFAALEELTRERLTVELLDLWLRPAAGAG